MAKSSEIDAMAEIEKALTDIDDQKTRNRILTWACDRFSSGKTALSRHEKSENDMPGTRKTPRKKAKKKVKKAKGKHKQSPSLVKDLNLKPKNKTAFVDFAQQKAPRSDSEKCTVVVYYLQHEAHIAGVGVDHLYTCFKAMRWRIPTDLNHTVCQTAHQKGWLDTSDTKNITVTTLGENCVEHDLARKEDAH